MPESNKTVSLPDFCAAAIVGDWQILSRAKRDGMAPSTCLPPDYIGLEAHIELKYERHTMVRDYNSVHTNFNRLLCILVRTYSIRKGKWGQRQSATNRLMLNPF